MATEITSYLMLQFKDSDGFIPNQDITHIIELEEGHGRPYWQWVKHPNQRRAGRTFGIIPESPSTIFQDGLLLIVASGLGDQRLLTALEQRRKRNSRVFDLNTPGGTSFAPLRTGLTEALEGYIVRLVTLPGSSLTQLSPNETGVHLEVAQFPK